MKQIIDWESLDLPDYEDMGETVTRIAKLSSEILKERGVDYTPEKNSPGFRPSAEQARQVAVMACLGLLPKAIASVLNIELKLLTRYYKKELTVSLNIANAMVAKQALNMATSGRHPDMTKFWLKTQAKWKEATTIELTGKDGGAVEITSAKDRLSALLAKRKASGQGDS